MAALSNTTQLFQYIHNFTYIIFFWIVLYIYRVFTKGEDLSTEKLFDRNIFANGTTISRYKQDDSRGSQ